MVEKKTIIVLGTGIGGAKATTQLVNALKGLAVEIIAVDSRSATVVKFAGGRMAAIGNDITPHAVVPNYKLIPANMGKVIQGKVTGVDFAAKKVTLDGGELDYDFLVCATGASSNSYADPPENVVDIPEIIAYFDGVHQKIHAAENIVIIGSGAVGMELAGEIKVKFPKKKVTVVTRGDTLVSSCVPPANKKFSPRLEKAAKKLGIDILFKTELDKDSFSFEEFGEDASASPNKVVKTTSGVELQADLVFNCTGKSENNSIYDSALLDEAGRMKVEPTLQVTGHDNVFAVGDLTNVQETKQGFLAEMHAPVVAANIKSLLMGKPAAKKYKPMGVANIFVPFGPNKGVANLMNIVMGDFVTSNGKGKHLFVPSKWANANLKAEMIKQGDKDWEKKIAAFGKGQPLA